MNRCIVAPFVALALALCHCAVGACRIGAGGKASPLGSIGGAPDAVLFSGYQAKLLPDGSLAVHDPVNARFLVFARNRNGQWNCRQPRESFAIASPPVSAIALHDGVVFGIDLDGQVRRLYPRSADVAKGESTQLPRDSLERQQPLLSEFARSNPLFQTRGVWPGADTSSAASRPKGEIGLSPKDSRLESVPNGVVVIGGREYRHAFVWSAPNRGELKLWPKDPGAQEFALQVAVPGILGAVDILRVSTSGYVLTVESIDLDPSRSVRVVDHVLSYGADGRLEQHKEVLVPTASTRGNWTPMELPPEVDPLSPDRLLYFHRDSAAMVTTAVDLSKRAPSRSALPHTVAEFAPMDPRRGVLLERAEAFLDVKWKATDDSLNNGRDWSCTAPYSTKSQRWAQPIFLRDVRSGSQIHGVPYLWGGKKSVAEFVTAISAGHIAGNVCTRVVNGQTVAVPNSAGVDCSGLVARIWELGDGNRRIDLSTVAIATNKYSRPVKALQDLQPGDVLNKSGSHVRLFAGWVRTPFGLRIRSYESTVDSICSGTCLRDLRARAYIGYKPRSYPD